MTQQISTRSRFGSAATPSTTNRCSGNVVHAKPVPCPGGGKLHAIKPGVLVDFETRYGPWHGVVAKVCGPVAHIKVGAQTEWTVPVMELKVREQ